MPFMGREIVDYCCLVGARAMAAFSYGAQSGE
jgi:hypothetical protein